MDVCLDVTTTDTRATTTPAPGTWVQRLLDNKTRPQRAVISLGALVAAIAAIVGACTALVRLVDGDGAAVRRLDVVPADTVRIESGTGAADEFVRALDEHDGSTVTLDHQLVATKGPADVTLLYGCTQANVCLRVRVQDVDVAATDMADGLWFAGCFAVAHDGAGYGYEPLDIELRYQGETCPS